MACLPCITCPFFARSRTCSSGVIFRFSVLDQPQSQTSPHGPDTIERGGWVSPLSPSVVCFCLVVRSVRFAHSGPTASSLRTSDSARKKKSHHPASESSGRTGDIRTWVAVCADTRCPSARSVCPALAPALSPRVLPLARRPSRHAPVHHRTSRRRLTRRVCPLDSARRIRRRVLWSQAAARPSAAAHHPRGRTPAED